MPNNPYTQEIRLEASSLAVLESRLKSKEAIKNQKDIMLDHAKRKYDEAMMELSDLNIKATWGTNTEKMFDHEFAQAERKTSQFQTEISCLTIEIRNLERDIDVINHDISSTRLKIIGLEQDERIWNSNDERNTFSP